MIWKSKKHPVQILIYRGVLDTIFDECDKYDSHETGGRLVGTFKQLNKNLSIEVSGVIEPGPAAKRTATSFFQDGAYQEEVFRSIEKRHPAIEHLGNWHTHHVNGYPNLSSGDIGTYQRIVNHANHNTDFLYALLIVSKVNSSQRYKAKHYLLRRGDDGVYEIPDSEIKIIDKPPLWPLKESLRSSPAASDISKAGDYQERAHDQDIFSEMYPGFKPFFSKSAGAIYWKGDIDLINGTKINIVVMESKAKSGVSYSINPVGAEAALYETGKLYAEQTFKSARKAVWQFERDINREIYSQVRSR